ncbi:hypothetical protein JX580_05035 [Thiomicrospira microaerophila]|uniref:hypothetical protein n=1 Tax=Thiomicrospira microaerophila TaxID=406020 RepID=UPI00200E9970|nr:hypothetical protein [Thiomicrospira microaerophila]UQB43241.1 hypothetical protein JX580_05035 [Thiomicrospira microaerophila]
MTKPTLKTIIYIPLLILAFLAGFIIHFPVALLQERLQQNLPEPIQIISLQGRASEGKAYIDLAGNPINLAWKLKWQGMFTAKLPIDLRLDAARFGQGIVSMELNTKGVNIKEIKSILYNPAHLMQVFDNKFQFLQQTTQTIKLDSFNATIPWISQWPTSMQGQGAIERVNLLGAKIDQINVQIKTAESVPAELNPIIRLFFNANEPGWQLNASLELTPNYLFEFNAQIEAQASDKLPDWAILLMQQQSPTQTSYQLKGKIKP